jgi:hypothetical protein
MYFQIKNTLKHNIYHTPKHTLNKNIFILNQTIIFNHNDMGFFIIIEHNEKNLCDLIQTH